MRFTQNFTEDDHRYIFKLFLRSRYPWIMHSVLTVAILSISIATSLKYGFNSPQTGIAVGMAAGYMLLTMFLMPKYMEYCVIRKTKKSVSFGKNVDYEADQYGLAYTIGKKSYQLFWNKFSEADLTRRGVFLRFGKRAGVCVMKKSFKKESDFVEFLALVEMQNKPVIQRRY